MMQHVPFIQEAANRTHVYLSQTRGSTGSSTLELVKMITIRQKTPTSQLLSSGSMCFGLYSAEIVHSRRARAMMYT